MGNAADGSIGQKLLPVSSRIEATQSPFEDVNLFDNLPNSVSRENVEEVSHYVAAMQHGLGRLAGSFPLSPRPTVQGNGQVGGLSRPPTRASATK